VFTVNADTMKFSRSWKKNVCPASAIYVYSFSVTWLSQDDPSNGLICATPGCVWRVLKTEDSSSFSILTELNIKSAPFVVSGVMGLVIASEKSIALYDNLKIII